MTHDTLERIAEERTEHLRVSAAWPTVVIGAGPVGLAAVAHLHARGMDALALEAGPSVGHAVRQWGHVRMFSPWRWLVDDASRALLERSGWTAPDPDHHPTGAELVRDLLEPLAATPEIAPRVRFHHRVTAITRAGFDRMKTPGRQDAPFVVVAETPGGEVRIRAAAVIDASGTWSRPNPLGSGGVPAAGEREHAGRIHYGIPAAMGADRPRYAGKRTLVVGGGHSAFNAVLDLHTLAADESGTEIVWAVRRPEAGQMFGGGGEDQLSARGALGERAREVAAHGSVTFETGVLVDEIATAGERLRVRSEDGRTFEVDEIVGATGFRPDLEPTRELRLELDPVTEAPVRLAPLIDPNVHSCGTVPPHGEAELAHPEPGYYAVGMKSYGRAPTFLLITGYEQVRSVTAYLAGDIAAARDVRLELPETGVCSTDASAGCGPGSAVDASVAAASAACCGPTADAELITLQPAFQRDETTTAG